MGARSPRTPAASGATYGKPGRWWRVSAYSEVTPNRIVLAPGGKHTARAYSNQTGEGNRPARRWIGVSRRHVNEAVRRITDAFWGKS